jgi:hypothetical protein
MKDKTIAQVLIGILLLAICGFFIYFIFSHAIPVSNLNRITKGLTEVQIKEIAGAPDCVRHEQTGITAYCYGGFQNFQWCSIEIYFGTDGLVVNTFHDH